MKKGQSWSLEIIIALTFFIIIFVVMLSLLFFEDTSTLADVQLESSYISSQLFVSSSQDSDIAFVINNVVDNDKLVKFYNKSFAQIQRELGVYENFCIIVKNKDGNVTNISGKHAVGSGQITVDGYNCIES